MIAGSREGEGVREQVSFSTRPGRCAHAVVTAWASRPPYSFPEQQRYRFHDDEDDEVAGAGECLKKTDFYMSALRNVQS